MLAHTLLYTYLSVQVVKSSHEGTAWHVEGHIEMAPAVPSEKDPRMGYGV